MLPGRGQARAAEDAEEIRFADVESLPLERGADVGQGGPLAAEFAGSLVDRIAFRGGLATGPGGGEERVDVGVASEVADDGSNGTDMKMKPLGDFIGGCRLRGSKRGRSRSDVGPGRSGCWNRRASSWERAIAVESQIDKLSAPEGRSGSRLVPG